MEIERLEDETFFSVFWFKLITILMYFVVIKVLKLKQRAAFSFPLHFLKYSLPAALRGGSRQTTARLGSYVETPPFALFRWNKEIFPLKDVDSRNVTRTWQRGK
jgi:hypothetical protein